jgi:hypothetical protein
MARSITTTLSSRLFLLSATTEPIGKASYSPLARFIRTLTGSHPRSSADLNTNEPPWLVEPTSCHSLSTQRSFTELLSDRKDAFQILSTNFWTSPLELSISRTLLADCLGPLAP